MPELRRGPRPAADPAGTQLAGGQLPWSVPGCRARAASARRRGGSPAARRGGSRGSAGRPVTLPAGFGPARRPSPGPPRCPWSWRSRLLAATASRLRSVGQVDHTVLVRFTGRKRQVDGRGFLWEEPWTGPAGERVDKQMQLVDQAVREHRSDQRPAAADVEVAVDLVLQAADRVAVVRPDDLRVAPR